MGKPFEVALFSVIQMQQSKCGRKWTVILYKPETPAKGKRLSLRWRFGLVKNCHSLRRLHLLLVRYIEKRNFKRKAEGLIPSSVWAKTFKSFANVTKKQRDVLNSVAVKIGDDMATFGATNLDSYPVEQTRLVEGRLPPVAEILSRTEKEPNKIPRSNGHSHESHWYRGLR
jgi:hypothetical protein